MTREELSKAIGEVDDRYIGETKQQLAPRKKRMRWVALAACLCLLLTAVVWRLWDGSQPSILSLPPEGDNSRPIPPVMLEGVTPKAEALAVAEYPTMAQYPEGEYGGDKYATWQRDLDRQLQQSDGYAEGMEGYYQQVLPFLLQGEPGENRVCSPLSLYMALSALTETVDGDSRRQLLSLLGEMDTAALQTKANRLWNANYRDDGLVTSRLANSLWLSKRQDVTYNSAVVETLQQRYFASTYQGDFGTEAYDAAMQGWINEQTGGLLKEQAGGLRSSEDTLMSLVNTVYFKARWNGFFLPKNNKLLPFHTAKGDVETTFMTATWSEKNVYWTERCRAVEMPMGDGHNAMWFLLPDENSSVEELLRDEDTFALLQQGNRWADRQEMKVHLAIPKFDVASKTDLKENLQALGVKDMFDPDRADFSPLLGEHTGVFVNKIEQAARVRIDEEGCEGAAYTYVESAATGLPPELKELHFTLDRPFLFAVTGPGQELLFTGVVEQPQ